MKSKRSREIAKLVDAQKVYKLEEAITILQKCPPVKFDQSVDVALKTGIDLQKSDQQVRGVVSLPNGTGKKSVIVVFAKGDKVKEALEAGADFRRGFVRRVDEADKLRKFRAQPLYQALDAGEFTRHRHQAQQQFGAVLGGARQ